MNKAGQKGLLIFSVIFYIAAAALMVLGSINDLQISINLFNPQVSFVHFIEQFGQFVYWAMWGPAFSVLFVCRRNLNESLEVVGKVFPFVRPMENINSNVYRFLNTALNVVTSVGFFALSVVGWKKLVENVVKNILRDMGRENVSQLYYFIICTIIAVVAIMLIKEIDKAKLRKLEGIALAGILLGIFYKIVEECKEITGRVRFREMIAYSNGFFNEEGLTDGQHAVLNREMIASTDFSHFTPWYKIGDDMGGVYNHSNSFPSGHTTYSCTVFMSYLFCRAFEGLKKLAPIVFLFSAAYVIFVGYTRILAGAHYLTDVAAAAIIGYTLFLIVYKIYNNFVDRQIIG